MSNTLVPTSTTTRPLVATATAKVTGTTLLAAAYGGTVKFAKERSSGTMRHWPVLEPGTKARAEAEAIMERRAAKQPVEAIAKDLNVSVPTVRRHITALAFTLELEGLSAKAKAALAKDLSAKVQEAPKEQPKAKAEPKAEQAPKEQAKPKAPAKPDTATVTVRKAGEPKSEAKPVRNTTRKARSSAKGK